MKVLKAKVENNELRILVDRIPSLSELVFEKKYPLYFAEKEGYVAFFSYRNPGNGYGGRTFNINIRQKNGNTTKEELIGPWSSRTGVMNKVGFIPSMSVAITDDENTFNRSYTFHTGYITVQLAKDCLPKGYVLKKKINEDGEIIYKVNEIKNNTQRIVKSNGFHN